VSRKRVGVVQVRCCDIEWVIGGYAVDGLMLTRRVAADKHETEKGLEVVVALCQVG
jgi:hypothetical protein